MRSKRPSRWLPTSTVRCWCCRAWPRVGWPCSSSATSNSCVRRVACSTAIRSTSCARWPSPGPTPPWWRSISGVTSGGCSTRSKWLVTTVRRRRDHRQRAVTTGRRCRPDLRRRCGIGGPVRQPRRHARPARPPGCGHGDRVAILRHHPARPPRVGLATCRRPHRRLSDRNRCQLNRRPPVAPAVTSADGEVASRAMSTMTVAALQMAMGDDVDVNVATAERLVRDAAAQGAQIILIPELFEGEYFCKDQLPEHLGRARPLDGHPTVEHFRAVAAELGVVLPLSIYERAGQALFNTVVIVDADGTEPRALPQEPHPRRPRLHREVLLQPRRHRLSCVGHDARHDRRGDLLGPVVPGERSLDGAPRRRVADVSHGDRQRTTRSELGFERPLATGDAGPRRRQPDAAGGRQSGRARGGGDLRDHVLRVVVHRRQHRREGGRGGREGEAVLVASFDREALRTQRAAWGLFRDRRPELYGPIVTLDGQRGIGAR
jgi:N-carbamoylputrescine amidase